MPLTTTRGVALYVGALLGPGLLVLPGLAATEAGPASILAWAGLLVLSGMVAIVFAVLGVAMPSAGGVAEYTRRGLGERAGRAVGWCFLAGIVTGAPVVCHLGVAYLGAGRELTAVAAGALLLLVLAVTRRGVRSSAAAQLGLVGVLLIVVVVAVAGALGEVDAANWTPFAPHGWTAIGSAAAVLMLSFVGWEAIAPLTGEFADPRRQLPRVIGAAFAITAVLYLALAAVTVAALGERAASEVPMAALLSFSVGAAGPAVAAVAAVLLTMGAANAYLTGGAALARDLGTRGFRPAIVAASVVMLSLVGAGLVPVSATVTVATSFFLVVYLVCMVSAARLLHGRVRAVALAAAGAVVVVLAFAGWAAVPALAVVAAGRLTAGRRVQPRHGDDDPLRGLQQRLPGRVHRSGRGGTAAARGAAHQDGAPADGLDAGTGRGREDPRQAGVAHPCC
jgi:amino acid efflux transporter